MDNKALDEALDFLNKGIINLNHSTNFTKNYIRLSHVPVKDKNQPGFYIFHRNIVNKLNSIVKPYKLKCNLFDIYDNKSSLEPERILTVVISKNKMKDDDYNVAVEKLMNSYSGNDLKNILDKLSNKVKVVSADYCYTELYKIYSIDIEYIKK